jgi:competence protein ComGC
LLILRLSATSNSLSLVEKEEMKTMMKRLRNKKGSEVIQVLIIIAIMGAVAVASIIGISNKIREKNTEVVTSIEQNIGEAVAETGN